MSCDANAARSLLTATAVRDRAHRMLAIGMEGGLPHFRVNLDQFDTAVEFVLETVRRAYPSLDVPFHSRWRHFVVHGIDRWAEIAATANWSDSETRARAAFDLAIVSVMLDAGAGPEWRYHDQSGLTFCRSEGLAIASLDMFASGLFSSSRSDPLRADADRLMQLSGDALRRGFQVSGDNPLPNLDDRAALLRRLGEVVADRPDVFGRCDRARPGGLFDRFSSLAGGGRIAAPTVLTEILRWFGPIWPSRIMLAGVPLGDCWRHPAIATGDVTTGLVPLHKLSQWLAYSLIEPLQEAGMGVDEIEGLTGLAEYRNGGLFMDAGVLALRDPAAIESRHEVGSPLVVEWRALTVALLDRMAARLRRKLGLDAEAFPMAKVLQGGTWAAGRAIARKLRANGAPPLKVVSDGTVF